VTHNVVLLVFLLAIALLIGDLALLNFGSRRASRALPDVDLKAGPLQSLQGGLRWPLPSGLGATNTPPVLVELELFDWGVRIRARWAWLRPFVPSWCARYEEIVVAEHVKRGRRISKRGSEGIRLRGRLAGMPVIFWTSRSALLLDLLESRHVAVLRNTTAPRLWTNN